MCSTYKLGVTRGRIITPKYKALQIPQLVHTMKCSKPLQSGFRATLESQKPRLLHRC